MSTPYQQDFWDSFEGDLWDDLADVMVDIYLQGIDGGIAALPKNVRVLANFDLVNTKALEFAKTYRYTLIKGITDTTRKQTQQMVSDWIQSGAPLDALETALGSVFGEVRAQMIAQSETTRVFAQANRDAFESTGLVDQVKWQAANDETVCPVCGALNDTLIGVGDIDAMPPAHPNCRCYILPIVSDDAVNAKLDEILA